MLERLVQQFLSDPEECECGYDERPNAETLDEAIRMSALSIDRRGRRKSHQWRIPAEVLSELASRLSEQQDAIRACGSFGRLHEVIAAICRPIRGAGELLAYDVAFRIGLFVGIEPELVYVHAGTRVGARALGLKGSALRMDHLPKPLRVLRPWQAEDFLCLYAKRLSQCTNTKNET